MPDRYRDRRSWTRVPMAGDMQWQSGLSCGTCRVVDMSPTGAAFEVPIAHAFQIGPNVALNMKLAEDADWSITERGHVMRKLPQQSGACRIAVRF